MQTIEQSFTVKFEYKTYFTKSIFSVENLLFRQVIAGEGKKKVFFVIDSGVAEAHPTLSDDIKAYSVQHQEVIDWRGTMVVQGGEEVKNDESWVQKILQAVSDYAICRHSYIVAIGGGAVLDMVGFAAAIAHRGVRHIRIPTTVLSQNDSGVGVKNSINTFGKKNFTGTFKPPQAVINDSDFLLTLDIRDWRSGISEAIKVALIKDKSFFEQIVADIALLNARNMDAMQRLIYQCAEMHIRHIAGKDPFEMGSSRPLDFGHWAAHKLEQLTHHQIRHGEAVAIGIALDTTYSFLIKLMTESEWKAVINLIKNLGFAVYHPALLAEEKDGYALMKGLQEFKEHLGGELTIMLLEKIGKGVETHHIDSMLMMEAVRLLFRL
ncbi:MAG: 3-dehydroquinate synthase [Cytophagales bacterium]|nr:MAG: 3-dehydroquinate synthase [Cytophagales bacterium]